MIHVLDPGIPDLYRRSPDDVLVLPGYEHLGGLEPDRTVVHVCTGPGARVDAVRRLATAGFRRFILEKPMAESQPQIEVLRNLISHYGLDVVVVGNFVVSSLTRRILGFIDSGELGPLRQLAFDQQKPRFARSLRDEAHTTAFDVEPPHSIGAALVLAGSPAKVMDAWCTDLYVSGARVESLGAAWLKLRHASGVVTEIHSDLTSPIRKRSVDVYFDRHVIRGHYPVSESDSHSQFTIEDRDGKKLHSEVLLDDTYLTFMTDAYRYFQGAGERPHSDFELNSTVVTLLALAKAHCGLGEQAEVCAPMPRQVLDAGA